MKKLLLPSFLVCSFLGFGQSFIQTYKNRANLVTQANINTLLNSFAGFGIKTTGSTANNNALAWLKGKYTEFGYTAVQISEHNFIYNSKQSTNLIVTKTGTTYPDKYIIICGHYDTLNGPGVNDNGSGTAIILEAARILQNISSEYSIKFINFSGEEQGLKGSTAYVNTVVNGTNPKMDIKLVFNIDQVGGIAGQINNKIYCDQDFTPVLPAGMYPSYPSTNNAASAIATQELRNCIELYSPLSTEVDPAERTDYMPFDKNNEVITGLYEFNQSNKPHTSGDTYVNMDPVYVYNVAQGVLGAIQHFSSAAIDAVLSANNVLSLKDQVSIFPNPATDFLNIGIAGKGYSTLISDISGKTVMQTADQQSLDTSKLTNGVYLLKVTKNGESVVKKFIIKR